MLKEGTRDPVPNKAALAVAARVMIRRVDLSDEDEFIAAMRASRGLHRPWVRPPLDAASFRAHVAKSSSESALGLLACRAGDGRIVGVFNLSQIVRGAFQSAYLSYYACAEFANQGYMGEAMQLVVKYAFQRLGLHRLEANIQPENLRSMRLVERSGFELEGFSPRYLKIGNRWRDHQGWAIRKEIWRPRAGRMAETNGGGPKHPKRGIGPAE